MWYCGWRSRKWRKGLPMRWAGMCIKSGSRSPSAAAHTLVAFRRKENAFFMYGFAKAKRANIKADELRALKLLAKELLGYSDHGLDKTVDAGE